MEEEEEKKNLLDGARPYQLELLDAALEENTIVLLGTGAGKTYIAVMLLKQLSYMILDSYRYNPNSKRTIFLVNTVPLVEQQAGYIRSHVPINVGAYYGSLGIDDWTHAIWNSELEKNNVLVMTRQIFLNMLCHGFINISRVNLLIFDECHHAVKKDPYVEIMKFYNGCRDVNERPKILGLSASIISGKCHPDQLERKIRDLETVLCSRTETAKDLVEVAKYATNPDEVLVMYSSSCTLSVSLKPILNELLTFLMLQANKTNFAGQLKSFVEESVYILEHISVSSAVKAIDVVFRAELQEIMDTTALNEWDRKLCELFLTTITKFIDKSKLFLSKEGDDYSPKLAKLLKILANLNFEALQDKETCGIIFVERRTAAVCLSNILKSHQDGCLNCIRSQYIVGQTGRGRELGVHMSAKKQQDVLKQFRSGKINFLVATSVVEEGLDVRKCNLVIRYDFPKTFQSHVQSKGRARAKNSRYVLLVGKEELNEGKSKLECYLELEQALSRLCHNREVPGEDEVERRLKHRIPPYQPYGFNGPTITVDQALSLLHRYCQKLPGDRYTIFAPDFGVEKFEDPNNMLCLIDGSYYEVLYRVTVNLPMNSPVKESITYPHLLPRVNLAKKAAALSTIEKLHKAGELDEHLKPVSHQDVDSDEEDSEKMEEKRKKHAGTDKRVLYYKKEVPLCLQSNLPVEGANNFFYTFDIRTKKDHVPLPSHVGLLTSKPIPVAKIPQFLLYIRHTEVSVSLQEQQFPFSLLQSDIETLKGFHCRTFLKVLNISGLDVLFDESQDHCQYLIVPVPLNSSENFESYLKRTHLIMNSIDEGFIVPNLQSFNDWQDKLVAKCYVNEISHNQRQLYEVVSINYDETPLSSFPGNPSITYAQYFFKKYGYVFIDNDQPSLTCRPLSLGVNSLKLASSRFGVGNQERRKVESEIKLFPEICEVWELSASLWKSLRCIPSILYRIESLLLTNELSSNISSTCTEIGNYSNYEYCTKSELSATDFTSQCLKSVFYINNKVVDEEISIELERFALFNSSLRKPDNALLLTSLTASSANDSVNLERLETLGDSFLKLSTTLDLFCTRSNDHEGKLSTARMRRISNFNLCHLAKKKGLPCKLFTKPFEPLSNWAPPCFALREFSQGPAVVGPNSSEVSGRVLDHLYHKAIDKTVADAVEALLGAHLVAGGIESAFVWLRCWLGLKFASAELNEVEMRSRTQSQGSTMSVEQLDNISVSSSIASVASDVSSSHAFMRLPHLVSSSSVIFYRCGLSPPSSFLLNQNKENAEELVHKMIAPCFARNSATSCSSLCDKLNWNFQDNSLLLQALTHPSYIRNRFTDCYQRLEFLGDTVLDYLITCFIYCEFPDYTPGQITNARSALVNNITFAEIAVKELGLHTYLLYTSPYLFRQITEYVEYLSSSEKEEIRTDLYCVSQTDRSLNDDVRDNLDSNEEEIEEVEPPKALGDVLESLAGALFLDCGMSLEIVWSIFYPFFKPLVDKFKNGSPPVHPIQELLQLDSTVEINRSESERSKHCCTIKVVDKGIIVTCTAKTYKSAKYGAAKRVLSKIKQLQMP